MLFHRLFLGEVLSPAANLWLKAPFQSQLSEDISPYLNGIQGDAWRAPITIAGSRSSVCVAQFCSAPPCLPSFTPIQSRPDASPPSISWSSCRWRASNCDPADRHPCRVDSRDRRCRRPRIYTLELRVASPGAGGTAHVEIDGVNATGSIVVPNTGGWQTWTSVLVPGIPISAGPHVLRLVVDTAGSTGYFGNINFVRWTSP